MEEEDKEYANLGLFLQALDEQRKIVGLLCPLQAVYISNDPPIFLGRCAFIFSISQVFSSSIFYPRYHVLIGIFFMGKMTIAFFLN